MPERITATELYQLRSVMLQVQDAKLALGGVDAKLQRGLLELARKYNLLASDGGLDVQTGIITRDIVESPGRQVEATA